MRDLTFEFVAELYEKYLESLLVVRKEQRELYAENQPGMKAQLDDVEAEITYLLLREIRPARVVEIGCLHGWSTSWILRALRDNEYGELRSYDRIATATRHVPPELSAGRWTFVPGDVRRTAGPHLADRTDYLFIDAAHSGRFAHWYLDRVLPGVPPGTPVSVHDVFHRRTPWWRSEGAVLLAHLRSRGLPYFTVAPARAPEHHARLCRIRRNLGVGEPIRSGTTNPMLFFAAA